MLMKVFNTLLTSHRWVDADDDERVNNALPLHHMCHGDGSDERVKNTWLLCHRDGRMLAAGGRSRYIHLWSLDTRRLLRIIEMPAKVTTVKQLEFLPDSFQDGFDQVCRLSFSKRTVFTHSFC